MPKPNADDSLTPKEYPIERSDQRLLTIISLAAMLLLLTLVFLSWLKIHLRYQRTQDDDKLSLEFFLWRFVNYKIDIPIIMLQQKLTNFSLITRTELETGGDSSRELLGQSREYSVDSIRDIMRIIEKLPYLKMIIIDFSQFLHHLRLERFIWRTGIGTPDAAATGILSGVVWALMGGATSFFYQQIAAGWAAPELKVEPNFKKEGFTTSLDCIFKIRVGNIMVTGLKLLKKKVLRRGVNNLGRASNRRFNEDCHGEHQRNG